MFKPGDRVICVSDAGSPLVKGDHYTIKEVIPSEPGCSETCTVEGVSGYWFFTRFTSVPNKETHMSSGGPYIASSVHQQALDKITQLENALQIATQSLVDINKPKYTPPPYIKSGWWIAMDADGAWWVFERKPTVDMQCLEWSYGGSAHELPIITGTDESMWHVPNDQWQQTLLQIP